jgi:tetratricopeptide (TPR) repeat protein
MGWSIFHEGQRKRGIILLERALNLNSNDPLILSDLGVCYLNEKNFERAAYLFKRVLEIEPQNEKAKECLNAVRFFQKEFKRLREKNQKN